MIQIREKNVYFCSHFFAFQYFSVGPIANETSMGLATPSAQELDLTPSELRDRCLRSMGVQAKSGTPK